MNNNQFTNNTPQTRSSQAQLQGLDTPSAFIKREVAYKSPISKENKHSAFSQISHNHNIDNDKEKSDASMNELALFKKSLSFGNPNL